MSSQPATVETRLTSTTYQYSAGLTTPQDHDGASSIQRNITNEPTTPSRRSKDPQAGEEQPLESHEVVELQKFSERKAWIEQKIKLLEKMPPIEVFVGLDRLRLSCDDIPGLPTRVELQQWLSEHDAIEKETEIFDSGELQKLKKLTKAATQRNLSPEDTDLIELTLTTIYDLDKLLHLLRDRSENLELLGVRLTWEEHRTAAWADRRNIIADLQTFLATRARWTPHAYDVLSRENTLLRKPSIASMSSDSSASPPSTLSRSARFKLGELLSRDAAQFVGRLTSLRHGKISAAGKALDKLIDNSRVPVPEELLDEQDRLEDKGINDVDGVDKFVMNVVMQWRKADEIYIETMKDNAAAQTLLEEVETAKLHHPIARQSTAFIARADSLMKRLKLRGNPASPSSSFPHPTHPLFPDQQDANLILTQTLSSEVMSAKDLISVVENLAKEYRGTYEAVRHVEMMCQDADELSNTFTTIIDRLENGMTVNNGDGSPPNLTSEACLDQSRHSVYLALFPSILSELDGIGKKADQLLRSSPSAFSSLDQSGIDSTFKSRVASEIQRLTALREESSKAKKDITARVSRLQDARKVWSLMGNALKELEGVRRLLGEAMESRRWRQESGRSATPPTPESPVTILFPVSVPPDLKEQLDVIEARLSEDITMPLSRMSSFLEASLWQYLMESFKGLTGLLENVRRMSGLLESIQKQADIMSDIRRESEDFQIRIEDLRMQFDSAMQRVLTSSSSLPQGPLEQDADMYANTQQIRDVVHAFIDKLSQRVPFVAQSSISSSITRGAFVKRRFSSQDLRLGISLRQIPIELPFELSVLDDAVRHDSNSYAMRLSGELQSLQQKEDHLHLARMARELDECLNSTIDNINYAVRDLVSHKGLLPTIMGRHDSTDPLQSFSKDFEISAQDHRTQIARSFSPIRELLRRMDAAPGSRDHAVHEVIYLARARAVDDAELKFNAWSTDVETFRNLIFDAHRLESQRLAEEHIAAERRMQEEQERRMREEAERLRLETFQRAEAERLAEEQRLQENKELQAAEEAERLLQQERILAEERAREGERQLAEEQQEKEARQTTEGMEGLKPEPDRSDSDKRGRAEQARLEEEHAIQVECERRAMAESNMEQQETEDHIQAEAHVDEAAHQTAETAGVEFPVQGGHDNMRAEEAFTSGENHSQESQVERENKPEETGLEIEKSQLSEDIWVAEDADEKKARERNKVTTDNVGDHRGTKPTVAKIGKPRLSQRLEKEKHTNACSPEAAVTKAKARSRQPRASAISTSGAVAEPEEDVFGSLITPSTLASPRTQEVTDLHTQIISLRKRLRSMNISDISRPRASSSAPLPSDERAKKIDADFSLLSKDVDHLPALVDDPSVDLELRSLRAEVEACAQIIPRILNLGKFSAAINHCDNVLSDLLEHIDSYPVAPMDLASSHVTRPNISAEEQLSARLSFTSSVIQDMTSQFTIVIEDPRAAAEQKRILQTWRELEDMGNDQIQGRKSRPVSVLSSGKNSSGGNSSIDSLSAVKAKKSSYSNLSRRPSTHGQYLAPTHPNTSLRRAISGSTDAHSRTSSRMSVISSHRSTSGPVDFSSSSLFRSTYASRQRTTSLSSATAAQTPSRRSSVTGPRPGTSQSRRAGSPTFSDGHSISRSVLTPSRSSGSTSASTWARAPRPSFPVLPRISSPPLNASIPRKRTYVANPKNKLDIAVGEVVNQLPVSINVEVVEDTWKDQSGKYWIGDQDPKLCFCRILRSQTVMVRVGGGWTELSKFIKDHFTDAFRLLPDSPPRSLVREEKWISSSILLEAPENNETPPLSPHTPEPAIPFVPTLSLLTPTGQSPRSLKSTPSTGSPLMPIQFMRRADVENSYLRPVTPSKGPGHRLQKSAPATPARHIVWRP